MCNSLIDIRARLGIAVNHESSSPDDDERPMDLQLPWSIAWRGEQVRKGDIRESTRSSTLSKVGRVYFDNRINPMNWVEEAESCGALRIDCFNFLNNI